MFALSALRGKVFKGALFYFVAQLLVSGSNFFLLPVWTAYLNPAEYGRVGVALAYATMLVPIMQFGLGAGLVRHYLDYRNSESAWLNYVRSVLTGAILQALLLVIAVCAVVFLWKQELDRYLLLSLGIAFFMVPSVMMQNVCMALEQHHRGVAIKLIGFVGGIVVSVWLVCFQGYGATGRLIGLTVASALGASVVLLGSLRCYAKPTLRVECLKAGYSYGIPLLPHALAIIALGVLDRVMIEHLHSIEEAGIYTVVAAFGAALLMVFNAFNQSWSPRYQRLQASGETGKQAVRRYTEVWFVAASCITIMFASFAPTLFRLMVDERYITGDEGKLIGAIGLAGLFTGVYQMSSHPIAFAKATKYVPFITVSAAIVKTTINWMLIPHYGGIVAAYSTVVAFVICAILTWAVSRRVAEVPTVGWKVVVILTLALAFSLVVKSGDQFSAISISDVAWSMVMVSLVGAIGVVLFKRSFREFLSEGKV